MAQHSTAGAENSSREQQQRTVAAAAENSSRTVAAAAAAAAAAATVAAAAAVTRCQGMKHSNNCADLPVCYRVGTIAGTVDSEEVVFVR